MRSRYALRCAARGGLALLLVWTTACRAAGPAQRIEAYHAALEVALGETFSAQPSSEATHLPSRRDRALGTADHRIGAFDFLALQGCSLGRLAGERNSQLGRVQGPTQRLRYELSVLDTARACVDALETERRARLEAVLHAKRTEMGRHVWNAVWTSEPMERYLAIGASPTADAPDGTAHLSLAVAARVLEAERLDPEAGRELELALGDLRDEPPLGLALRQLERIALSLETVSARLERQPADACGTDNARLARAFDQHYLPAQAAIVELDRDVGPALGHLDAIYRASAGRLDQAPEAMARYHARMLSPTDEAGVWQRHRRASVRHARAWEPVLRACDRLPSVEAERPQPLATVEGERPQPLPTVEASHQPLAAEATG